MFRTLINDAKSAAGAVVGKYAIRVSVALPFIIAFGFGTAAATLALIDRFGAIQAYCFMTGGFAAAGLLAAIAVTVKEQEAEVAEAEAEKTDTANVATDAAAQAAAQLPLALLGTLLTTPMGPGAVAGGAKAVLRNLPLVILVAVIAFLFWPSSKQPGSDNVAQPNDDDVAAPSPDPGDWPMQNGADRQADHYTA